MLIVRLLIMYILLGIISAFAFSLLQWSIWALIVVLAIIGITLISYILFMNYFSKDLSKIEAYLNSSKRNPQFQYALSLKYGKQEDQIKALELIISKSKRSLTQTYYKILHAVTLEDYKLAREEANNIHNDELQQYAFALISAHEGKQAEAAQYRLAKPWMVPFIEAILALKEQNLTDFNKAKSSSVKKARGIQRFINAWYFQNHEEK